MHNIDLPICLSIYSPTYSSFNLSIYPSTHLSFIYRSTQLFIPINQCVYPLRGEPNIEPTQLRVDIFQRSSVSDEQTDFARVLRGFHFEYTEQIRKLQQQLEFACSDYCEKASHLDHKVSVARVRARVGAGVCARVRAGSMSPQ